MSIFTAQFGRENCSNHILLQIGKEDEKWDVKRIKIKVRSRNGAHPWTTCT